MAGGIVNIVTYGAQDLYLTGTPEITHFKVIYRRYTNFAMESFTVPFEDFTGFGIESRTVIPVVGDLMHKTYLQIEIPEIKFPRTINSSQAKANRLAYQQALANLNKVADFMSLNMDAYRDTLNEYNAENDTSITAMRAAILQIFNIAPVVINTTNAPEYPQLSFPLPDNFMPTENDVNTQILNAFRQVIGELFDISKVNLNDIAENINLTISKDAFLQIIQNAVNYSYKIVQYFREQVTKTYDTYQESLQQNLKFAWVKRLGHAIIDYIDIYIGGDKIDRHFGDWINVWYELAGNRDQEEIYLKMIGDVPELTTFDRTTKPKYLLQIPLQFWFCRFNGLALPLVALEYHDVTMSVKLKKFRNCAYAEKIANLHIDDLFDNNSSVLNMNLIIDYVYLDGPERRKFAQSAHEYLIDQLQYSFRENLTRTVELAERLDFNNPTRELIWTVQRNSYVTNNNGSVESKWWNYGVNPDGTINPVINSKLDFNGYSRVANYDGNYFNYVQPYQHHSNAPCDGVNVYSFSIHPEEQQPSGACNFSRIANALLTLTFDQRIFTNGDTVTVRIYGVMMNVLRIINGMGALAFSV